MQGRKENQALGWKGAQGIADGMGRGAGREGGVSVQPREARPAQGCWSGSRPLQVSSRVGAQECPGQGRTFPGSQRRLLHSELLHARLPRGGQGKEEEAAGSGEASRGTAKGTSARLAESAGGAGSRGHACAARDRERGGLRGSSRARGCVCVGGGEAAWRSLARARGTVTCLLGTLGKRVRGLFSGRRDTLSSDPIPPESVKQGTRWQ